MKFLQHFALMACMLFGPALALAETVDLNTADAQTLSRVLHGVGLQKAEAIVADRDQHGPFKSPDDLSRVKGIGRKTIDDNRERIVVGGNVQKSAPTR